MKHTSLLVGALMFSLGLNVVLVGMGIAGRKPDAARPAPVPVVQSRTSWTNLFSLDDQKLKLTPEQKANLDQIRRRIDQEELQLNGRTVQRWDRWTQVLVSNNITTGTMTACVDEMTEGTEALMKRSAQSIAAQRAVLDPGQQKVFDEILRCRMKKLVKNYQGIYDGTRERMTTQYGPDYMRSIGVEPTTGTLAGK
ncbi:MAG: Spy/CpxP family protein refolding chaperone [Candidatus Sumerlaeia bacterium]